MDEEAEVYSGYMICQRRKSWHVTSEPTVSITLNHYMTLKDKITFRSKGNHVTMQTSFSILSRTFWKKKKNTYRKENERNACGFGRKNGFKRMVGMKQENGLKSESIRKIMRQKRLTEKDSRVGGPTLHWKGAMQTPSRRWEGGLAKVFKVA